MRRAVVISAKRTPIGKFLGMFKDVSAVELGVLAVTAAMNDAGIEPSMVDELIFGNARQAGSGPNPARQIAFRSGIPESIPSYTVNKACGSGLKSIILAVQEIALGNADVVVAGGTENMTRVPFMVEASAMRFGFRLGHTQLEDGMYRDGFLCPISNLLMGRTAENLAEKYDISRREQDEYAVSSQRKCEEARKQGKFQQEICPVAVKQKKDIVMVKDDEHPRDGVTVEQMVKLPAVFKENGTVHAGNSSGITDGAAALVIMSEEKARKLGVKQMAFVGNHSIVGVAPEYMGIGPVPALQKLQKITKKSADSYDLIELNEAFAAQVIACLREIPLPMEKVNVNGGSIALGHPIGCTGARIAVTLLHEMARREAGSGLATLCISGGLGMALEFYR